MLISGDNPNTSIPDTTFGISSPGGGGSGGSFVLQAGRDLSFAGAMDTRGADGSTEEAVFRQRSVENSVVAELIVKSGRGTVDARPHVLAHEEHFLV